MKTFLWLSLTLALTTAANGQQKKPVISITHLEGDFYIHQSWISIGDTFFPCNGLYLVTKHGVVLIDTPADEDQTAQLVDSIATRHHKKIVLAIATHFHTDRTGGFNILRQQGVKTWSSCQTHDLCLKRNDPPAQFCFTGDTSFTVGTHTVQTYYPGEGHTKDNIVIWFDKEKILFGGCLVKSTEAEGLGNLADANPGQWPASIENLIKRFPSPRYIIPGHQGWTDKSSLTYTLDLLRQYKNKPHP
jgi:metallo-beta-lactamase class B